MSNLIGRLSPGVWVYPGDPTGARLSAFNPPAGVIVLNSTGGAPFLKTSPRGDNSGYSNALLDGHSVLTYAASVVLDFKGPAFQTVTLTGNITFTTSNLSAPLSKTLRIIGDGSERTLTFPEGWKFVGAVGPSTIAASKVGILTVTSFGTADANCVAAYAVEP